MKELKRTLESGTQDQLGVLGDYVYVKASAGPVKIITEAGDEVVLEQGQGVRFVKPFNHVQVFNAHGLQQSFTLLVGRGDFQNNALIGEIASRPVAGQAFVGLPAFELTGSAQQLPENGNRRQIIVRSAVNNSGTCWIGGQVTGVGFPLAAGDVAELDVAGAVDLVGEPGDILYLAEVL